MLTVTEKSLMAVISELDATKYTVVLANDQSPAYVEDKRKSFPCGFSYLEIIYLDYLSLNGLLTRNVKTLVLSPLHCFMDRDDLHGGNDDAYKAGEQKVLDHLEQLAAERNIEIIVIKD